MKFSLYKIVYSGRDFSFVGVILTNHLHSNTTLIDETFEKNLDDRKFDGRFVFKDRLIWFKKYPTGNLGNHVYLFRGDQRKSAAEVRFQNELDSNWGEEEITETDFFANTRRGLYAFVSNIDGKPLEIYMKYKERWDIEQCFDYLKNSVRIGLPTEEPIRNLRHGRLSTTSDCCISMA